MIDKNYQIKVYELDWTYKTTINPKQIMDDLDFSANINGWQGELNVTLALPFDDVQFALTDVVKLYEFDVNNKNGRLIYTGYATKIEREFSNKGEFINLVCIGLYSMLNTLFWYSWSYTFAKNQAPNTTITNMIDYFNSVYTWSRFSYTGVTAYGSSINIEFDYTKCNDVIKNIQQATKDFYFYVDKDWNVIYKTNTFAVLDHNFTIWKDVDVLKISETVETVVNKLILEYGTWPTTSWPYESAPSQATYWKREWFETVSQILDVASANNYGNKKIAQTKDMKREVVLTINNAYDLESIKPWQFVKVSNIDYTIYWLQIQKITYNKDKVVIYLDQYKTFADTILSNNL